MIDVFLEARSRRAEFRSERRQLFFRDCPHLPFRLGLRLLFRRGRFHVLDVGRADVDVVAAVRDERRFRRFRRFRSGLRSGLRSVDFFKKNSNSNYENQENGINYAIDCFELIV